MKNKADGFFHLHISGNSATSIAALRLNFRRRALEFIGCPGGDDDRSAEPGQLQRSRKANPRATTGNDGHTTFEVQLFCDHALHHPRV